MKVQIKCDEHRAELLARELGKIRIWLTGWHAGRSLPGQTNLGDSIPGEQSLWQVQQLLNEGAEGARRKADKKSK